MPTYDPTNVTRKESEQLQTVPLWDGPVPLVGENKPNVFLEKTHKKKTTSGTRHLRFFVSILTYIYIYMYICICFLFYSDFWLFFVIHVFPPYSLKSKSPKHMFSRTLFFSPNFYSFCVFFVLHFVCHIFSSNIFFLDNIFSYDSASGRKQWENQWSWKYFGGILWGFWRIFGAICGRFLEGICTCFWEVFKGNLTYKNL